MATVLRDLTKQGEIVSHVRSAKYDPAVELPPSVGRRKAIQQHRRRQVVQGWPKVCNCAKCGGELRWPSHYGASFETRAWVRGLRAIVAAGWMCYECWLEKNAPDALTTEREARRMADDLPPTGEVVGPRTARQAKALGLSPVRPGWKKRKNRFHG